MATELEPLIGEWYLETSSERLFSVTDVDEDEEIVETEDERGEIQQIALSTWYELDLEPAEAPEGWESADDDLDDDDDDEDVSRWDDEADRWDQAESEWDRPHGSRRTHGEWDED